MRDEALCRYFQDAPGWRRQLEQLRNKALSGYSDGTVRLRDASVEECLAAERLLGRHFTAPELRYRVSDFEAALRASKFAVRDMGDFWLRLDGEPLVPRAVRRAGRADEVSRFFKDELRRGHGRAASDWLRALAEEKSAGYQMLAPRIGRDGEAALWLRWVCCALDRLEQHARPEELALCSYAVSTDPHALDADSPAGRLLLHALAHREKTECPSQGRARQALLRRCGLMTDDLSAPVAQRGLRFLRADGSAHPALEAARRDGAFCLLTASQLDGLRAESPTGRVYILENQMVFSSLCRRPGIAQPMLCTAGQLRGAAWRLLDLLAESGCELWYAGDFDPEGLGIADRLWQEYGDLVRPWHMEPEDYFAARSETAVEGAARLRQLENIRCPTLRPVAAELARQKRAGYQEALTERYWSDLRQTEAAVSV